MQSKPRSLVALLLIALVLAIIAFLALQQEPGTGDPGARGPDGVARGPRGDSEIARVETPVERQSDPTTGPVVPVVDPSALAGDPIVAVGRVVRPEGVVFDGLEVELHDAFGTPLASADVDAEGRFAVRHDRTLLPGWNLSTSWIRFQSTTGGEPRLAPGLAPSLPLHRLGTPPIERDLVIARAPTLFGTVIDESTGLVVEDATIAVLSNAPAFRDNLAEEEYSLENGRYELPLEDAPLQEVVVWCRADEFQTEIVGPLDLSAGERREISFRLRRPVRFAGRVVDEATGRPVAGAEISVMGIDYGLANDRVFEVSGLDGSFDLDASQLPLGRSTFRVTSSDYAVLSLPALDPLLAPLRFAAPPEDLDVDSDPPPAHGVVRLAAPVMVTGIVEREDGTPVEAAEIYVVDADEWSWDDPSSYDLGRTDVEGRFQLLLEIAPAGNAVVYLDEDPSEPFLAPLRSVQLAGSSVATREVKILLAKPLVTLPAASQPAAGGGRR